jgi:YidC/Oxa1 family membrane protein insertase
VDRNAFLAIALSFAVLSVWMTFTAPPPKPPAPPPPAAEAPIAPEGAPAQAATPGAAAPLAPALPPAGTPPAPETPAVSQRIAIETPLYHAELDTVGGTLADFELQTYRLAPSPQAPRVVLTTAQPAQGNALATPFAELGLGDLGRAGFAIESSDSHGVAFRLERSGVVVRKQYRFDPESYAFELRILVENGSGVTIRPEYGLVWPAHAVPGHDFVNLAYAALHEGSHVEHPLSGFGVPGFFSRTAETEATLSREIDWAGVNTTYFVAALLPEDPAQASARIVASDPGKAGQVEVFFEPTQIPPGQSAERVYRVYVGPKESERLEAVGSGLVRSINLGWNWLSPLTLGFGWLLRALHSVIPNYGVGIILLTVLVRLVTTPLTMKQMKSMERMRLLQPKLQELREKFPDDRQKQSEEMMKLYRREGVNPLGGCLPMLLQLPVFIGLFYALQSSIDLRQAPFVGWINDLSAPDALFMIPGLGIPLRVLPLLNGAAMVVQQKISPAQIDPAQARMMMIVMPVMMTVLFYQFPSGLVLYWTLSSVLAIAHQLWVGRGLRPTQA